MIMTGLCLHDDGLWNVPYGYANAVNLIANKSQWGFSYLVSNLLIREAKKDEEFFHFWCFFLN
jgi:hypothetical protein